MRPFALLLCLLIGSIVWAAEPNPEPDDDNDAKTILGSWQVVKAVRQGKTAPAVEIAAMKMQVTKDKFSMTEGIGKDSREDGVTYKLDMKSKPRAIDLAMERNKKVTLLGIYKFDKGELTICSGEPGAERPTKFDDKTGLLMVFRKAKAKK